MNAATGVDGENDLQRKLRLALKDRDLLRMLIFREQKLVPGQAGTGAPLSSVTLTKTFTNRTLTLMVGVCAAKPQQAQKARADS